MADQIRIRASSISNIVDCPKRGLSIALGLVAPLPSTAPAAIGTACHAGTAAYDKINKLGAVVDPYDCAGVVENLIRHPEEEVFWGKITQAEALRRAMGVYTRYFNEISGQFRFSEVEMTLENLSVEIDGTEILLTGTLDRLYIGKNRGYGVMDVKTGARVCSQPAGKHKPQLGVYQLLAEYTLGIKVELPAQIAQLQTSANYDAAIQPVDNAIYALLGRGEEKGLLHHIAAMLQSGDWYGNSSSWLCSENYCPLYNGCIFR